MCGIEINESKTKIASADNLCGEFVSRNLNHGKDVSRISANICRAVGKNILDLPQLASHLSERDLNIIIPMREIFKIVKIKEINYLSYLRTFVALSMLYPNKGLHLLTRSVRSEFPKEYYEDEVINILNSFGKGAIEDTFKSYQVGILLNSIIHKLGAVVDSAFAFDSSEILATRKEPDK